MVAARVSHAPVLVARKLTTTRYEQKNTLNRLFLIDAQCSFGFGAHMYMYNADDFVFIIFDRVRHAPYDVYGVSHFTPPTDDLSFYFSTKKNATRDLSPYICAN